jgi:hypothetical protein
MGQISDIAKDNSELMEAVDLLRSAVGIAKHRQGFDLVMFHLGRVRGFGKGHTELDLHLDLLESCLDAVCNYV